MTRYVELVLFPTKLKHNPTRQSAIWRGSKWGKLSHDSVLSGQRYEPWFRQCTTERLLVVSRVPHSRHASRVTFQFDAMIFDAMIPILVEVHGVLILQRSRSSVDVSTEDTSPLPQSPIHEPAVTLPILFSIVQAPERPRGAAVPSRTNGTGCNWTSHIDTGREVPVKGGFDELNEGSWDFTKASTMLGPV